MIDIKDTNGNIRFSTPINKGGKRKFMLMKEDCITLKFSLDTPLNFKLGDNVDCTFGLFELMELCKPSYNGETGGYDYELRLDAYYWKWRNKVFKFIPEAGGQEAAWNLTASLATQMDVFLRNLENLGYTYRGTPFEYVIEPTVDSSAKLMSYSNTNMIDALSQMAEVWECEWWVTDNIIHFGRCEYGTPVDLKLGDNVNEMTRSESQNSYATRIYAFGSTRNLPADYRPVDENTIVNGIVQKRLMLPVDTPCIDAYPNMSMEEAIEDVVVFEDIYPRRTGTMSGITLHEYTDKTEEEGKEPVFTKWNAYRFRDPGIAFSEKYVLPGQELKIIFQSGALNGMEFSVIFNPCDKEGGETPVPDRLPDGSLNPAAQVWEICRNEECGRPLPDNVFAPKEGDTYVLSGFDTKFISGSMLADAEIELKQKAEQYVAKMKVDPSTYTVKMNSDRMVAEDGSLRLLELGDKVRLFSSAYFDTGSRVSRIIGFEYNLDMPYDSPVYTVGETASYSRIGEMEGKIDSLVAKQNSTEDKGKGVYVVGTNDSTPATNRNVFSALRSIKESISKVKPDVTSYLVKFLGGLVTDDVRSQDYTSGAFGSGHLLKTDRKTGKSYLEVDELYVRLKAYFDTLEIKHTSHVGGQIVLSPAGMVCAKVEYRDEDDVYRCYFKSADGEKTVVNEFAVDDLVQSREFNIKEGAHQGVKNQYYWRRVVGIGEDYIELSGSDCDAGSMPPAVGDTIVTVGNKTNPARQHVIILSTVGMDAPNIKQYAEVDSYSLVGKEVTAIGPKGNKFRGDFVLKTGTDILTQFRLLENLVYSAVSSVRDEVQAKDNYLANAAFASNTDGWETTGNIRFFTLNGMFLRFNDNFYSRKDAMAAIVRYDNRNVLRIIDTGIKQLNADLANKPAYGEKDKQGKFFISFRYKVSTAGMLASGFPRQNLYFTERLEPNEEYAMKEYSGTWDGTGDFELNFTGDMYIHSLALTDNAFEDMVTKFETALKQTDESIEAVVKRTTELEEASSGWITTSEGNALWACKDMENGENIVSVINQTAESVNIEAHKINFVGKTIINGNFIVDEKGNLTLKNINAIDGTFSGTVKAGNGNVGGFKIEDSRLVATSENDKMLLSPSLIRFTNEYVSTCIGANTIPSSSGGHLIAPLHINVKRNASIYDSFINTCLVLSVEGAKSDDDIIITGNHALYIEKGGICGFRLRTRRITTSTTLGLMDSIILTIRKGITLTLPTGAVEDGQMYFIRNHSDGDVFVHGKISPLGYPTSGNTNVHIPGGYMGTFIYDVVNNVWLANHFGRW
ncbi:phage tail protein [uncultured Bacteroides sp.]|uniref:phage tail protein n=1 Tax=uncultured Bacteroides sp. TaxID=162156 RepID=UPI0026306B3F|nr:phage tail protein [uncultured Bacteroides sp.]